MSNYLTYEKNIRSEVLASLGDFLIKAYWTLSLQNWAINTKKPSWVVKFFDLRNLFLLIVFGLIDFFQLILFDKASDIQYLAKK